MACEKVFQIAELREMILQYAVYNDEIQNLSTSTFTNCRLVNWDWLETTSKCVQDRKAYLVSLHLNTYNQANGEERIARFIKENAETRTPAQDAFPPVALLIDLADHLEENCKILESFLTKCSTKLVHLTIQFLQSHLSTPMPAIPPLKMLYNLRIRVQHEPRKLVFTDEAVQNMSNFVQSTLSGSDVLRSVILDSREVESRFSFESVILPSTLRSVTLFFEMERNDWKVMTNSHLPKLRNLDLNFGYGIWENDLVTKTLEPVCETLCELRLNFEFVWEKAEEEPVDPVLHFPLMKKLAILEVDHYNNWGQPEPLQHCLEENLPELKILKLKNITATGFLKWTENVTFKKVINLHVSVTKDYYNHAPVFSIKMARLIKLSFPGVRQLTLGMRATHLKGLKYVFAEFTQLMELNLEVLKTSIIDNSDLWDALLIGVPLEFVKELRQNPGLWENAEFKENNLPSIRNLTELRELGLIPKGKRGSNIPLISDAAFKFGFLEMPSLKTLVLKSRFRASKEMTQMWTEAGRRFDIY